MIGLFCLFFNSGEIFHFFIQGADIKLIYSLVNKKAPNNELKALKKFEITKPTLFGGNAVSKPII
jgi:hypothetical protein